MIYIPFAMLGCYVSNIVAVGESTTLLRVHRVSGATILVIMGGVNVIVISGG